MDILHYLDVAIGFTLALMVLVTLIGTTTAMWLAAIQSKVKNLEAGLQQVLGSLGSALPEDEVSKIVKALVRDRMVPAMLPRAMPNKLPSWLSSLWSRFGATESVGREEFVPLLLRAAAAQSDGSLATMIQEITHHPPKTTLRAVELAILNQEAANPSDPANVWRTRGLAEAAPELAAQVFSQFDDVIARADDNAAFSRKLASGVLALIFLTIYPVNSFDIISRLLNDKAIAASVAAKAGATDDPAKLREVIDQYGLFGDVFSGKQPSTEGTNTAPNPYAQPGVWTTFVLVSLGAPFWPGLLDKLLGLRSKITAKTEKERAQRAAQNSTQ